MILAGAISDGRAIRAAEMLGADDDAKRAVYAVAKAIVDDKTNSENVR